MMENKLLIYDWMKLKVCPSDPSLQHTFCILYELFHFILRMLSPAGIVFKSFSIVIVHSSPS